MLQGGNGWDLQLNMIYYMIYHMMCNHVIYSLMYNGSTADSVHWDCCSVLMYCVLKKAAFLMVDKTGFSQRAPIYGGHVRLM